MLPVLLYLTDLALRIGVPLALAGYKYAEHHSFLAGLGGLFEGIGIVTFGSTALLLLVQSFLFMLDRKYKSKLQG
jgi:hypothetical protein